MVGVRSNHDVSERFDLPRTPRRIDRIVAAPSPHWVGDGFFVSGFFNAIPDAQRKLSPFLLLDYGAPREFPPTANTRQGVGPHPHRGFETVTIAFQGSVAHHDSTGQGRGHRARRRPVDDGGLGDPAPRVPRGGLGAEGRHDADGPDLGQPAARPQDGPARLPGHHGGPDRRRDAARTARAPCA